MILRRNKRAIMVSMLGLAMLCLAGVTQAAPLTIELSNVFSGDAPFGQSPWLTATFTQNGSNQVTLTLEASLQDPNEFISKIYFNLDPALNPISLNVLPVSGPFFDTISFGADAFKADGDGYFDIMFQYPTADNQDRFDGSDVVEFDLSLSGLTPESFEFLSVNGNGVGPFMAAAHVQGITGPAGSGWISEGQNVPPPVPEPATLVLLGLSLFGLSGLARARKGS